MRKLRKQRGDKRSFNACNFSGGSGVGKNTVISELLKKGGFALMPTYTTRDKRPMESEGNPYCFLTESEFKQKIDENELYEYENVHGHYYGTSKLLLKKQLSLGKILLKDIDVLGTQNLVKSIGKDVKIITLFLKVDSKDVLVKRLTERKETEIEKRLARYDMEMSFCDKYDYVITNNDLFETKDIVLEIINAEKQGLKFGTVTSGAPDNGKVEYYVKKLQAGETLSPIITAFYGGRPFVLDGREKYLASLITGKSVAKEIKNDCKTDIPDQAEWNKALDKIVGK